MNVNDLLDSLRTNNPPYLEITASDEPMIYVEVRIDSDTQYLTRIDSEQDIESMNAFIRAEMAKRKQQQREGVKQDE